MRAGVCLLFLLLVGCDREGSKQNPGSEDVQAVVRRAEQSDVTAQFNLGMFYAKGRGVTQDDKEAVKWYRKAAEQGDADAQNNPLSPLSDPFNGALKRPNSKANS